MCNGHIWVIYYQYLSISGTFLPLSIIMFLLHYIIIYIIIYIYIILFYFIFFCIYIYIDLVWTCIYQLSLSVLNIQLSLSAIVKNAYYIYIYIYTNIWFIHVLPLIILPIPMSTSTWYQACTQPAGLRGDRGKSWCGLDCDRWGWH